MPTEIPVPFMSEEDAKNLLAKYLANLPPPTPEQEAAWDVCDRVYDIMCRGDAQELEQLTQEIETFPHGCDPALERRWLINAIDAEAYQTVVWMVEQNVELSFVDEEGITPLAAAIDRKDANIRYALLRLLLSAGARHDLIGLSGNTAAHVAACRNDLEALKILKEFGADLCISTDAFDWWSPLDAAHLFGFTAVIEYIESVCGGEVHKVYLRFD